jgi:opacity protein-like surface antigen
MKKGHGAVSLALLVAALVVMPVAAQSAMWVGGELGGNFITPTLMQVNGNDSGNTKFADSVISGLTVGYDFVNAGFGAYSWPDWMKYFSFGVDFTYNRLLLPSSSSDAGGINFFLPPGSSITGHEAVLTFLFMGHYGFLPDSEVPAGRIHPYLGVGPGIVFSSLDLGALGLGTASSTAVALVVEPGIRFMVLKNVSIDTAFRYRLAAPSYDFNNVNIKADALNQCSFLARASYHF